MRPKKSSTFLLMMILSLILLIVLQGLWLRTEYKNRTDVFNRETNLTLRSTLHQITDTLWTQILIYASQDTTELQQETSSQTVQGNEISEVVLSETISDTTRQLRRMQISLHRNESRTDTTGSAKTLSPREIRWRLISADGFGYNADSIALYYRRNLNPDYADISFEVMEREIDFNFPRQHFQYTDTLPFTTAFHPFARKMYAIEFHNAGWLIMRNMFPQVGFALFTTTLIFISFMMIYRNSRAQQRLIEQKANFIGNITHELKTPVASVSVALEAMKHFDVLQDRDKTLEYLELSQMELSRLETLIDKILKTSFFDYSEEIKQNQSTLDMTRLVESVLESFRIIAKNNSISLQFHHEGETRIQGNKEHLAQAIYNLIDNAIKYASEGKYIGITLLGKSEYVFLTIEDKGPGIPAEYRQKIFEKFYRIPTGNIHNVKGYGLGLHYVAGVINQHHGKITLESKSGQGSRFIVELPVNTQ